MRLHAVALAALLLFPAPSFAVTRVSESINERVYTVSEKVWYKLSEWITGDKWVKVKEIVPNPTDDAEIAGYSDAALHKYRDQIISSEKSVTGPKITPLDVIVTPDGRYMPANGNHRLRAAQETQVEWVRIRIIPKERR